MFRLIAVTLAALYVISTIYGDPSRRQEVARGAVAAEVQGFSLAAFSGIAGEPSQDAPERKVSRLSDAEAVRLALAAGAEARADRSRTLRGTERVAELTPATDNAIATDAAPANSDLAATAPLWTVSGDKVNLREGPGTGNAVVGQVTLGTEAEVLDARNGWYQIRTTDGAVSGWIFGKFLEQREG